MTPWIGFVYTFPNYRSNHYMGYLIENVCQLAKQAGNKEIFVSTDADGLYEKYGFTYTNKNMQTIYNNMARVYNRKL